MLVFVSVTNLPKLGFFLMGGVSLAMAAIRWRQTMRRWDLKVSLAGKPFAYMKMVMLKRLMAYSTDSLWVGFGFEWSQIHTHRAIEMRMHDDATIMPPAWFLKLKGVDPKMTPPVGKPWIHGIGGTEKQIYVPLSTIEGHTAIFGTTGSGKTRMFETLITQAVLRGEPVICIDPKGDKDLEDILRVACTVAGRPRAFLKFHPGFPSDSVRLDLLANWNNITEIASRIASLMDSSGSDSFVKMSWKAVHIISESLVYVDQMPNLVKLRRFIEGGPEKLMEQVFRSFYQRTVPHWETLLAPLIARARDGKLKSKVEGSAELIAAISFYRNELPENRRNQTVDGLLAMVEHNREHLGKILANLVPLLVMLTSGELAAMLSPDPTDLDDPRPIMNTRKVLDGDYVLYVGLDSLSNGSVGSALGAAFLSDLAAVAGDIYNYYKRQPGVAPKRKNIFVDEAAEVTNEPLIALLNKSRGAGFVLTLASQTFADYVARMGDEAKARQIMGNCNNVFALRTKDRGTQDFIVETFGETRVQSMSRTIGVGSETESTGIDYRTTSAMQMKLEKADMFPPELLGMLPNLHYIAMVSGGRMIKGRLPKLMAA
jgi:conjugal transfer pilus assembly protein TraD